VSRELVKLSVSELSVVGGRGIEVGELIALVGCEASGADLSDRPVEGPSTDPVGVPHRNVVSASIADVVIHER
jgi:hypothetical protein